MTPGVYDTRLVTSAAQVDAAAWDALLLQQASPSPFMQHAFLAALEGSKSAEAATGWAPQFLLLEDAQGLAAATVAYAKSHSYGEYVFDWAWADAYRRHGLEYYPKLLTAVPFTPVPGTRLLARDAPARTALAVALRELARQRGLSSAHVLFMDETDAQALSEAGFMMRRGVQFHWQQNDTQPVSSFDELLATMQRHKRKNIVQERRRVREAGVLVRAVQGDDITTDLWDFFYRCYTLTYRAHGSLPYLTRRFFALMAQTMPQHWLMFVASREGQDIACSLLALDPQRRCAYGRYWGCTEVVAHLHFEACYYAPLQWCLEQGYRRFEGGAQGEHKMARGLLPVPTQSAHWIADPRFASAVDDFLAREGQGMAMVLDELRERSPFKPGDASWPSSPSPC
jgi:uncharacterized protein